MMKMMKTRKYRSADLTKMSFGGAGKTFEVPTSAISLQKLATWRRFRVLAKFVTNLAKIMHFWRWKYTFSTSILTEKCWKCMKNTQKNVSGTIWRFSNPLKHFWGCCELKLWWKHVFLQKNLKSGFALDVHIKKTYTCRVFSLQFIK